jgi:predicted transcriptional regulator
MELTEIKHLRKKFGLTQTQLAKLSGVSQSLIAKIEADRIDPTFSKAQKIFDAMTHLRNKNERSAHELMNRSIIRAQQAELVTDLIKRMKKHNISQMPVYDGETILGIVTEATILEGFAEHPEKASHLRVGDIIQEVPPTLPEDAPTSAVISLLKYYPIIFVGTKGKVTGIITKADVLEKIYS